MRLRLGKLWRVSRATCQFVAGPDASVEEASHSLLQFPSFLLQHVFGTPRLCGRLQVHSSRLYLRYDQSVCPVGIASSSQDLDFRRKLDTLRASDYRSLMQFIHKVCFDQQKALRALSLYVLWVTGLHRYARGGEPCSTARGPDPLKKLHAVITTTLRLHVPM